MLHYLFRYIKHIRRQSQAIKEMHAILFATFFTIIIVSSYMYSSPLFKEETSEGQEVISMTFSSPFSLFVEQVKDIFQKIKTGNTFEIQNSSEESPIK